MSKSSSRAYDEIKDRIATEYRDPKWSSARRWLTRVGVVRLTADYAAMEAVGLLRSINLSTHRNEPELAALLVAAREAANAYLLAASRANWKRFEKGRR